jgi:superfamily II RNA helicase
MSTLTVLAKEYSGDRKFSEYPFELSNFQKNAIDAHLNGDNVFIAAPTGSGKTLPAEYAINNAIKNGTKIIYTTPIKTLSNQKFKEFTEKFTDADVGILTGDIKYNPSGNILIMTTEILRNLLFNKKIQDIANRVEIEIDINKDFSLVVFDEIHYINDKDRGKVWEESIILLPESIQIIMLSATVDNPIEFCDWVKTVKKRNIVLSSTEKRIVPLRHAIYTHYLEGYMRKTKLINKCSKFNNKLTIFSDEHVSFNKDAYQDVIHHLKQTHHGLSRTHVYRELIQYLTIHNLTPCIFFCFSRKKCEQHALSVAQSLCDNDEISQIRSIIEFNLRKCDNYKSYVKLNQYSILLKCLEKGVAFHHSGLIPVFKEIVEILYGKHLVKVLFATETFAVGVNMPTKTVVFTSLEKYTGNDFRCLYTHEYLQMGGRAGRRGIDTEGIVILLPNLNELPNIHTMNNLINGSSQTIQSKFTADYKLILKTMLTNNSIDNIVKASLLNTEIDTQQKVLTKELNELVLPDIDFSLCEEYASLINPPSNQFIKIPQSVIKKNRKKASKIKYSEGFENKYNEYLKYKPIFEKQENIKEKLTNGNYITDEIRDVVNILASFNYIDTDKGFTKESVTLKGMIASEINECNELILTELIYNNHLDDITYKDLGAILSIFGDSRVITSNSGGLSTEAYYPQQYAIYIDAINKTCADFSEMENNKRLSLNYSWNINTYLMDPTYMWLDGTEFEAITQQYGLFEGNLIKDFIRIYNLSAEVEKAAGILNKTHLQVEAAKIRDHVVRDIVNIESLYIK